MPIGHRLVDKEYQNQLFIDRCLTPMAKLKVSHMISNGKIQSSALRINVVINGSLSTSNVLWQASSRINVWPLVRKLHKAWKILLKFLPHKSSNLMHICICKLCYYFYRSLIDFDSSFYYVPTHDNTKLVSSHLFNTLPKILRHSLKYKPYIEKSSMITLVTCLIISEKIDIMYI